MQRDVVNRLAVLLDELELQGESLAAVYLSMALDILRRDCKGSSGKIDWRPPVRTNERQQHL